MRYAPFFGWVCEIDPPSAGPVVVFRTPYGRTKAVQCTKLRWNHKTGGVEVEGRQVHSRTHVPFATPNGEPIHKILHLREVTDVHPLEH